MSTADTYTLPRDLQQWLGRSVVKAVNEANKRIVAAEPLGRLAFFAPL